MNGSDWLLCCSGWKANQFPQPVLIAKSDAQDRNTELDAANEAVRVAQEDLTKAAVELEKKESERQQSLTGGDSRAKAMCREGRTVQCTHRAQEIWSLGGELYFSSSSGSRGGPTGLLSFT